MVAAQMLPGRTIVVGNLKGGTGKSTVSVNLSAALASRGCRVALVDTDPQGTAYEWIGRGLLPVTCIHKPVEDLNLSGEWLGIARALRQAHEFVLIDLPATVAPALALAYLMADLILIPTSPSGADISGSRRAVLHVRRARAERLANPPKVMLVPSRVVDGDPGWIEVEKALDELGEPIGPPVRLHAHHQLAFDQGDWAGGIEPGSSAHRDVQQLADAALLALELPDLGRNGMTGPAKRRWPPGGLPITTGSVAVARAPVPAVPEPEISADEGFRLKIRETFLGRLLGRHKRAGGAK